MLISLNKRGSDKPSNVVIRGIGPEGTTLRPQVRIVAGRMFRPGSSEIVAGRSIGERFVGAGIGEQLRFGMRDWTVVGLFDAGGSGFDSEIWGDADQLMQAFRRTVYSSVILRLARRRGLRPAQGAAGERSAPDRRGQARIAVLRRAVGGAGHLHPRPRH